MISDLTRWIIQYVKIFKHVNRAVSICSEPRYVSTGQRTHDKRKNILEMSVWPKSWAILDACYFVLSTTWIGNWLTRNSHSQWNLLLEMKSQFVIENSKCSIIKDDVRSLHHSIRDESRIIWIRLSRLQLFIVRKSIRGNVNFPQDVNSFELTKGRVHTTNVDSRLWSRTEYVETIKGSVVDGSDDDRK